MRSQTAHTRAGQLEDSYQAFEIICRECGDDPSLDYCKTPPLLQRLRGPYWLAPGAEAYENNLEWHDKHRPVMPAEQVLGDTLGVCAGEQLLIHGAGGLLVVLAALRGAQVIATAGPSSQQPLTALGARHVIDCRDQGWPAQVRAITGNREADAAVNVVSGGGHQRDRGGRRRRAAGDHHLRPARRAARHYGLQRLCPPNRTQLCELATPCADGQPKSPVAASYCH